MEAPVVPASAEAAVAQMVPFSFKGAGELNWDEGYVPLQLQPSKEGLGVSNCQGY